MPSPLVFFALSWLCSSSYGVKVVTYIFLFLQEEDDWKEFEQKEEIDYSGLRVQSMQIRYFFLPFSSPPRGSHFIFLKIFFPLWSPVKQRSISASVEPHLLWGSLGYLSLCFGSIFWLGFTISLMNA